MQIAASKSYRLKQKVPDFSETFLLSTAEPLQVSLQAIVGNSMYIFTFIR